MSTRQVLFWRSMLSGVHLPAYAGIRGPGILQYSGGTEAAIRASCHFPMPTSGQFTSQYMHLYQQSSGITGSDPGVRNAVGTLGSGTLNLALNVNAVDTALACAIVGDGVTFEASSTASASVSPGDLVSLHLTNGIELAYPAVSISFANVFVSDAIGESIYPCTGQIGLPANNESYCCAPFSGSKGPFFLGNPDLTVDPALDSVVATDGPLTRYDVWLSVAPGGGKSQQFAIWRYRPGVDSNYVKQDGTGGTVDTTLTMTGATVQAHASFSLDLAANDRIILGRIGIGTPASTQVALCFLIRSNLDGYYNFETSGESGTQQTADGARNQYGSWSEDGAWADASSTSARWWESDLVSNIGLEGFYVTAVRLRAGAPPGTGAHYTVQPRVNLANPGGTVGVLADLDTDLYATGSQQFVANDLYSFGSVPANDPTFSHWAWTFLLLDHVPTPPPPTAITYQMRRVRRFPLAFGDDELKTLYRIEFIVQSGVGLANFPATQIGTNPILMVRFSRDGGQTWGNRHDVRLGKVGEYFQRAYLTQLGQGRNWVCEVVISDPVFSSLIDCLVDLRGGTH